jgi:hypothetical protein
MASGNPEDFEPWPEMKPERLLDMFPESELVKIYALPRYSAERAQSWESLGVTDPAKQAACEVELDQLIAKLAEKNNGKLPDSITPPTFSADDIGFEFIWGK